MSSQGEGSAATGRIGFVGLSHLGIVSSLCLASRGWPVTAFDSDETVVSGLVGGKLPIHEPGLAQLLTNSQERIRFTSDVAALAGCNVVIVSQDVQTDQANESDLTQLKALTELCLRHVQSGTALVVMSQVPVGFMRDLSRQAEDLRPGDGIGVFYWVETLIIGDAVERYLRPERQIVGRPDPGAAHAALDALLGSFDCPVVNMSFESAELTKMAINLYLATSVSYANQLADLCEATGASMAEVIPALRLDKRIGAYAYIRPSLGIAGGNIERDLVNLQYLGYKNDVPTALIDTILTQNSKRYHWLHARLFELTKDEADVGIAVWGIAYKRGTQATKNSFAVKIMHELSGRVALRAYDPLAQLPETLTGVFSASNAIDAAKGASCLLVMTDWPEFGKVDLQAVASVMKSRRIVDCVGILDAAEAKRHGFEYRSIGNM